MSSKMDSNGVFSHKEEFRVQVVNDDDSVENVIVSVGIEGVGILDANTRRAKRKYPLPHIQRWTLKGASLLLYTKSDVDIEERQLVLKSDHRSIATLMDTLTMSCFQLSELVQAGEQQLDREQANVLKTLAQGKGKIKGLPAADEVEFWHNPDKEGWMQSQGEVLKTWRRRWFVLKQGYLFRFLGSDVTASTKPRGIVNLSTITDVATGKSATRRDNSLKLSAAKASILYLCDSETEMVEWMSALEGAMFKCSRSIAGVDDRPAAPEPSKPPKLPSLRAQNRSSEAERTSSRSVGGGGGGSGGDEGSGMVVNVVDIGAESSRGRAGDTYTDMWGNSFGLGSGRTFNGIAGIGGVAGPRASDRPVASMYPRAVEPPSAMMHYGQQQQQQQQGLASVSSGHAPGSHAPSGYGGEYGGQAITVSFGEEATPAMGNSSTAAAAADGHGEPQGYSTSIIDQLPAQHTSYGAHASPYSSTPTYAQMGQGRPPMPHQVEPVLSSWQMHYTADGRAYYHNTHTGATQWEQPAGFA